MSYDIEAFVNEHDDPVVITVTVGTFDVSRLVDLQRHGRCEDLDRSVKATKQLLRHNAGRKALALLRSHSGPADDRRVDELISLAEGGA